MEREQAELKKEITRLKHTVTETRDVGKVVAAELGPVAPTLEGRLGPLLDHARHAADFRFGAFPAIPKEKPEKPLQQFVSAKLTQPAQCSSAAIRKSLENSCSPSRSI